MKTCDGCSKRKIEAEEEIAMVPFAVYKLNLKKMESQINKLWIALIVAISMLFVTNIGWMIYESQFETISYEQDGAGLNNVNVGEQGDVINGAESEIEAQEEQK